MSGHSKWSTIKHKKAKTDAQKGKAFSKVSREIIMAAKIGGEDISMNPRLRLALQKAKEVNMPNDNVQRAIKKGAGADDTESYEEVTFEGYGPNGVAILIDTLTDNRNRTVPNLKTILNKAGGSLASKGSVSYLFDQKGVFVIGEDASEDSIMEAALEFDIEELETNDDQTKELTCDPKSFHQVREALENANIAILSAALAMIPKTTVSLDEAGSQGLMTLIEKLEDDDDVQEVYTNAEFADGIF